MKKSRKTDAANWWKPVSRLCKYFFWQVSFIFPWYLSLTRFATCSSFRSVFLNSLLEKALRTACAVKDLLPEDLLRINTCRRVGYVGYGAKRKLVMYSIVLNLNGILRRIGKTIERKIDWRNQRFESKLTLSEREINLDMLPWSELAEFHGFAFSKFRLF